MKLSVSQDSVFLLAHLANPAQVLSIKWDYFKLHSLIITLLPTFLPPLPIAMFLVVVTLKHCVFKASGAYTTRIIYSQHLSFQTMLRRQAFSFSFFFLMQKSGDGAEEGKNLIWVFFLDHH